MNPVIRFLKFLLAVIFIPVLIYFVLVLIGAAIPVNSDPEMRSKDVEIYLISNGMHIDIAVPFQTEIFDWSKVVKPEHSLSGSKTSNYVSFGWGDLQFYRTTPEWKDLTAETAFKSLFTQTPAAVHATFLHRISEGEDTRRIVIDSIKYRKLSNYIVSTFEYDSLGNTRPIPELHYNNNDVFYHAKGSLNLFKTCNTWVNNGLKESGLKACYWTPFVEGVFLRYPKEEK